MILTLCLESEQRTTDQNTIFSAEMLSLSKNALFFVKHFGKEKCLYNEFDACNEFCITLLYILAYIYIYVHYLTKLLDLFTTVLCFSKNVYLILNRHECNFQLHILQF